MSGLIRGKRLVWVRTDKCWRAETYFGVYRAYENGGWDLSTEDDWQTISDGTTASRELAQSACQSDHDLRAMASIQVGSREWKQVDDYETNGICIVEPCDDHYRWQCTINTCCVEIGVATTREKAITAAEKFVTRLVMGERE
jgi:hypothetical protein